MGGGVDGHGAGVIAHLYTPGTLRAMRSAGLGEVTYRLRTELAGEAWHWNPAGRWSDPAHAQGYWTSDTTPGAPITLSFGYALPRRGNTNDQANDEGYSRLDDGDAGTFWKSNPYLAPRYTHDDSSAHPQWIIVDLGRHVPIDAIAIRWAAPLAARFDVEYWRGEDPASGVDENPDGAWRPFPLGTGLDGRREPAVRRLSPEPIRARLIRIMLRRSSGTAQPGTRDPRDSAGYAVGELGVGRVGHDGALVDAVRHAPDHARQTVIYVSSTDPWHRAVDRDPDTEQPGLDLVFASGLTNGRAPMLPVPAFYDTPDNAAAEITYLRRRGYPLDRVELGEEADGQYASPDDYGAIYLQTSAAIVRADSLVEPGGPSWQSTVSALMMAWREDPDRRPWLTRFLDYLDAHGARDRLRFFSFEWYPFDDVCAPSAPQVARATALLDSALASLTAQGLSPGTPRVIAEFGYSAFAGQAQMTRAAALLDADIIATFLAHGGSPAYLYGWEPSSLDRNPRCGTWGNNTMFLADQDRRIRQPTATYRALRLLTRDWLDSAGGPHQLYATTVGTTTRAIGSYAVRRADGGWSLLLINRAPRSTWHVTVRSAARDPALADEHVELSQLSAATYVWHAQGAHGHAHPDRASIRRTIALSRRSRVSLPPYSLTVIRWPSPARPGSPRPLGTHHDSR